MTLTRDAEDREDPIPLVESDVINAIKPSEIRCLLVCQVDTKLI
jgi:hypothetical protein